MAFFPAYPALAAILHHGLRLDIYSALLLTSQAAAWGFWSYFFLFCQRWSISPLLQFFGAVSILAHPTAFFLIAGYSESLFMMGLFGFKVLPRLRAGDHGALAVLHGLLMSATRIRFASRVQRIRSSRRSFETAGAVWSKRGRGSSAMVPPWP